MLFFILLLIAFPLCFLSVLGGCLAFGAGDYLLENFDSILGKIKGYLPGFRSK